MAARRDWAKDCRIDDAVGNGDIGLICGQGAGEAGQGGDDRAAGDWGGADTRRDGGDVVKGVAERNAKSSFQSAPLT